MQRKRTPKGLSAAARQAVDDYYANPCPELSSRHPEIAERLDVLERYWVATQGLPVRKAAKVVGKGLTTIDEWVARLEEGGPANLAKRSTRPHKVRPREKRTRALVALITRLRNRRFAWGRDKIKRYLRRRGWEVSEATIGRIIGDLLSRNKIKPIIAAKRKVVRDGEAVKKQRKNRQKPKRKYAVRKKPEPAKEAGDMVQADTMEVPLYDDVVVYIMSAVDVVTRQIWSHLCVSNNSENAAILLSKVCEDRVPKRIQTDGGSEFRGHFEALGHELGIVQHVLPPSSPKLNGHIECVNANIVREFLNFWILSGDLKELEASLAQFVYEYNHIRPHEALDFETPIEWYNARAA